MKTLFVLLGAVFLNSALAAEPQCTTTPPIQYEEMIPVADKFSEDQRLQIIYAALNYAPDQVRWDDDAAKEQWQHERTDGNIVYAGINIRSHWLQTAITITDAGFVTIVCDSANLKQTDTKIHRKVPQWKSVLDDELRRVAQRAASMGMAEADGSLKSDLQALERLRNRGLVTDEEYDLIFTRANSTD